MPLRQLNFGVLSVCYKLFYLCYKGKLHFSVICSFLFLRERGVEPWMLRSNLPIEGWLLIKKPNCTRCLSNGNIGLNWVDKVSTFYLLYLNFTELTKAKCRQNFPKINIILDPWYAHESVSISGYEMLVFFWKILSMY